MLLLHLKHTLMWELGVIRKLLNNYGLLVIWTRVVAEEMVEAEKSLASVHI